MSFFLLINAYSSHGSWVMVIYIEVWILIKYVCLDLYVLFRVSSFIPKYFLIQNPIVGQIRAIVFSRKASVVVSLNQLIFISDLNLQIPSAFQSIC